VEKLKGHVSYGRTVNIGNYNTVRIEFGKEFYLDESDHDEELRKLAEKLNENIKKSGIARF